MTAAVLDRPVVAERDAQATSARRYLVVLAVIFATWAIAPELRRLLDWRVGFERISIVSVLPVLALALPVVPLLYGGRLRRVAFPLLALAWIWVGAFVYSLAIAIPTGNALPGIYAFARFVLPMTFGLWVATHDELPLLAMWDRLANILLWLAAGASVYGVYQFVALPPWDLQWMLNVHLPSIGPAAPYQFRIFGPLNSPGPFGDFLIFALLFNLPRLRQPRPLVIAQVAVVIGALALSLVRSDWIALAVGSLCYVWLSPYRLRNIAVISTVATIGAVLIFNASMLLGSTEAGNAISSRFNTFNDLNADDSYNVRLQYFGEALQSAAQNPLGEGLGVIGIAGRLGSGGTIYVFDNGYIARFTEMGYFGTACYLIALITALVMAYVRWRAFKRAELHDEAMLAAAVVAIQVALIVLDLSDDHHTGYAGMFFWLSLALIYGAAPPTRALPRRYRR